MSVKSEFAAVGLAHKFMLAAEQAGLTATDINALAQDQAMLRNLFQIRQGNAEVKVLAGPEPRSPFATRFVKDVAVLRYSGSTDWSDRENILKALLREGHKKIVVNMEEISLGNADNFSPVLLAITIQISRQRAAFIPLVKIKICGVSPRMWEYLRVGKLEEALTPFISKDEDEAIAELSK